MWGHKLEGKNPISVLGFLRGFQTPWKQNGVSKGAAIWCFQVFIAGATPTGLKSHPRGERGAHKRRGKETLRTYQEVENFSLRVYVSDVTISQVCVKVQNTAQSTWVSEGDYRGQLRRKPVTCANVFNDNRKIALLAEGLLPAIKRQARHQLTINPKLKYM